MDKQTNELDRIVIGVREWAAEKALDYGYFVGHDEKRVLEQAKELEDFVLRKLPQFLSYLPVKEEIV